MASRYGSSRYGKRRGRSRSPDTGGGLFDAIPGSRLAGKTLENLKDIALGMPAGLYETGRAVALDVAEAVQDDPGRAALLLSGVGLPVVAATSEGGRTRELGRAMVEGTYQDLRHPLRNPGYTLLDVLAAASAGAGGAARLGAAARASRTGGSVSRALLTKPQPGVRTLRIGDLEVAGQYSRSPLARTVQRMTDTALQRGAAAAPAGRVAGLLERRASKWLERTRRVEETAARSAATRLEAIGRKLKPEEQMALRLVAEETPVDRVIASRKLNAARARDEAARARFRKRIDALEQAAGLLDEGPGGKPVFKADQVRLRKVFDQLRRVAADREEMLAMIGRMTPEEAAAAKTRQGRIALGAEYVKPTPGRLGKSASVVQAERTVRKLERKYQQAVRRSGKRAAALNAKTRPRTRAEAEARLAELEKWYDRTLRTIIPEVSPYPNAAAMGRETRRRRAAANRRRLGSVSTRSAAQEVRELADQRLRELIEKYPDNATLQREARLLEEYDQLSRLIRENAEAPIMGTEPPWFGEVARNQPVSAMSFPEVQRVGGALSVARDELERARAAAMRRMQPTGLVGVEDFEASPEAVFIGRPVQKSKLTGKPRIGETRTIGHPRMPGSLKEATGAAERAALERTDVTRIVVERYLEAARLTSLLRLRDMIAKAGRPVPLRSDDVAMRLDLLPATKPLPGSVRRFLDDPESLSVEDAGGMIDQLRDRLFRTREEIALDPQLAAEFDVLAANGELVWIPRRLLGNLAKRDPLLQDVIGTRLLGFTDAVNNAQKAALIYLKPAYLPPQMLSNAFLNLTQQGAFAPANLARSVRMNARLGEDVAAVIDDLMGEGAIRILSGEGEGPVGRSTRAIASHLSRVVDAPFRRASFLHEARRAGYRSPDDIRRLVLDPGLADDLRDVTVRATQEIVDFGELGPIERAIVRRVVFVYPWVKGSSLLAGRFLRDKPVQAAVLGQAGRTGLERSEQQFGPVPSYLEGAFPVGDRLVNPGSFNPFGTPAQIGQIAAGLISGRVPSVAEPQQLLAPVPSLALALATRRDQIGRPVEGGLAEVARDELIGSLPQTAVARALFGRDHPIIEAVAGPRKPSKTFPDESDAYWRFLLGGLWPRRVNRSVLNDLARRERERF